MRENLDPFGAGKEPGEQGSPEWLFQRVGNVTGSKFAAVMDYKKNGAPSAKRTDYLWEIVAERLTGTPTERFVSGYMEWGTEQEPAARIAYEGRTGAFVEQTGYRAHPTIARVGGSVDGLVDDDGIIEIKCPATHNHLETMLSGMPEEHIGQVQGYLWITGRQWCDFVSFDPRLPEKYRLYIQRIARDEKYIASLEKEVIRFLGEVEDLTARIEQAALAVSGSRKAPVGCPSSLVAPRADGLQSGAQGAG